MFEFSDHSRNRRLGNPKLCGCLGHTALVHCRAEHVEVSQLEPPTDLAFPVDFFDHNSAVISIQTNMEFSYRAAHATLQSTRSYLSRAMTLLHCRGARHAHAKYGS